MKNRLNCKFPYFVLVFLAFSLNLFGQYQYFAESYNLLSTIAGKGELDDRGTIGWLPKYENTNALEVELTRPHFAMADSSDNIYIADKDAHGIRMVTTNGTISTIAGTNIPGDNSDGLGHECQLSSPNGIWVKADGTVYILDLGNNKIKRLNTNRTIETIVYDEVGISLGRGLWVTPSEDTIFYSSATQIKMWTKEKGIVTYSLGYRGLGNITMDKNGYVVATDRTANLVYRISKDGKTKEIIAGNGSQNGGGDGYLATQTGLNGVRGVWFLDDNSYFVATHEGSQIWYIDVLGNIHLFLDGKDGDRYHSGDGENYKTPGFKISEPRSVSMDNKGNVLIVENDKGFVRKIENEYTYYFTNIIHHINMNQKVSIYPNPAINSSKIKFHLAKPSQVKLTLFNNLGQNLITINQTFSITGLHSIPINIIHLPNGIYQLNLLTDAHSCTKQLMIKH